MLLYGVLSVLSASPFVIVLTHAVLQRIFGEMPPQRVAILSCFAALVPVLGVSALLAPKEQSLAILVVYTFITYSGIAYSYFHLFNLSETARRIRLLREIFHGGSLSEADLHHLYREEDVVDVRLDRMTKMGQLAQRDEKYVLGGPTLYYGALVVYAWRVLLGFERDKRNQVKGDAP